MFQEVHEIDEIRIEEWDAVLDDVSAEAIYEDRSNIFFLNKILNGREFSFAFVLLFMLVGLLYFSIIFELSDWGYILSMIGLFSIGIMFFYLAVLTSINIHGTYYIIGEKRIVRVPRNSESPDFVSLRGKIDNMYYNGESINFVFNDEEIEFPVPGELDFIEIQTIIYHMR